MGIGYSKGDKDTEIQHLNDTVNNLKNQLQEKSTCVTLLENELNALRNMGNDKTLNPDILKEMNRTFIDQDYEYLVLSGGGIKGISYTGALLELDNRGILYDRDNKFKLKGIAAASAGAIMASLIAIGYKPQELNRITLDIDFEKIFDDKLGYFRDTINFFRDWGVCPGDYIQELLGELIKQKTGNANYTLEDLYRDKGVKLVIVTTDMCTEKTIYLYAGNPVKEFSNIPIKTCVRASMGIPFAYAPYKYNGCFLVDGGLLDNYPLHVFDGDYPGDPKARLNLCCANPKVLGLKIMTTDDKLDYDIINKQNFDGLFSYAFSYIDAFLSENDRRIMTPSFWLRSIIIVTPDYSLTKFNLTDKEKADLIEIGKRYVDNFFTKPISKALLMKPMFSTFGECSSLSHFD